MRTLLQDIRFASRVLRKNPGLTAILVLTLALGIGSNSTVYSTARTFLLAPFPGLRDPDRLVRLVEVPPHRDDWADEASPGSLVEWRRQSSFSEVAACDWWLVNLTGEGEPERVIGIRGTANYFQALGFKPFLGRGFLPGEDQPGRAMVTVLSYGLWQRRYGGDPKILGRALALDGRSYTVVGIMPPDLTFPEGGQLWVPLALGKESAADFGNRSLIIFARLHPGVSIAEAQSRLSVVAARTARDHPVSNAGWGVAVWSLEGFQGRLARPLIVLLFAAVSLVLLIVCANVANLLLARASVRQREFAVRSAIGASPWRLLRQRLTETVLLALLGGALGTLVARWEIALLRRAIPGELSQYVPAWSHLTVDSRVLGFTVLTSLAVGIAFGIAPAFGAARVNLREVLKEGGRGATGGRGGRLRRVLVVSEMALALMLLVSTGLMVKSFVRILTSDPGFRTDHLLTLQIALPAARYPDPHAIAGFYTDLIERARALPGVRSFALVNGLPLSGWDDLREVEIEGRPVEREKPSVGYRVISEGYFATMGIPLLHGRSFARQDQENTPGVAIVNQAMARLLWPGENPLAQRIRIGPEPAFRTIVGIVRDIRDRRPNQPPRAEIYVPFLQAPTPGMALVVRTAGDPAALTGEVERQIAALDPALAAGDVRPFERVLAKALAPVRVTTGMLIGFALLALLLAGIGIYGVISLAVASRTQEIGIRLALGAQRREVLGLIVGQGLRLLLVGLGIGLAGSFALTRGLASILFGVSATDLVTFVAASTLLAFVALFGSYVPALRAARLDPLDALRSE